MDKKVFWSVFAALFVYSALLALAAVIFFSGNYVVSRVLVVTPQVLPPDEMYHRQLLPGDICTSNGHLLRQASPGRLYDTNISCGMLADRRLR